MKACVFCGIGITEDERMSAGPTYSHGSCCPACFDKHVVDHMNPKRDILKETGRTWID